MNREFLRYQAFLNIPEDIKKWPYKLLNALKDGNCPYFHQAMKVRIAKGFQSLVDSLNSRDLRHDFLTQLTNYLGSKGANCRHRDGEHMLNPQQQKWIIDFFVSHSYKKEVVCDQHINKHIQL